MPPVAEASTDDFGRYKSLGDVEGVLVKTIAVAAPVSKRHWTFGASTETQEILDPVGLVIELSSRRLWIVASASLRLSSEAFRFD